MALTKSDLARIQKLIDLSLELKVPKIVREELKRELKRELSHLPNKDEFYKKMDEVMGELKKMRESYELAAPQISDHETRIMDLEKIHPQGKHAFA
jgi:DNA replication initiation complex subunit (GINS family)